MKVPVEVRKEYEEWKTFFIMMYHDREDSIGIDAIKKQEDFNEKEILLYQIFKDADALDRFRLGENGLDIRYLRTDTAKEQFHFVKQMWEKQVKK